MATENKNPWGSRKPGDGPRNPWGSGGGAGGGPGNSGGSGGSGGGNLPPDLEELLKKAQANMRRIMPGGLGPLRVAGLVALAAVGLWLASGFYFLNPGENAVITQFGKWSKTKSDPGLGYRIPWPVQEVATVNVTQERKITIGFAEGMAGRGVAGKRDIPEESLMLTSDANIIDLDFVVFWNIENARDYLFNIMDPEQTIKKVAESAIREIVGQTKLQPITTGNREDVASGALKIMQSTLDSYKSGVSIIGVSIQEATVHPDVIEAFEDVVAAQQDAERFQNEATIYANDIVPKARGEAIKLTENAEAYREAAIAKAKGDADRFNAIYAAYVDGKEVTKTRLYIEAMEDVLKNAQKIIVDDKTGNGVVPYLPLSEIKPAAGDPMPASTLLSPPQQQPSRTGFAPRGGQSEQP
jgi:membrane protease subunit HflK